MLVPTPMGQRMQFAQLKRREFITLLGGIAAMGPLAARAQQPDRVRQIGVLMGYGETDREGQAFVAAFREGRQKLGWVENRNMRIDYRWPTPDDADSIQRSAKELVALQPDVILSNNTATTAAMLQQTRTIPIIFANVADPVLFGFGCSAFSDELRELAARAFALVDVAAPLASTICLRASIRFGPFPPPALPGFPADADARSDVEPATLAPNPLGAH
jgi:ABC transporter substrate binding protein